jgi:hypothetical protein
MTSPIDLKNVEWSSVPDPIGSSTSSDIRLVGYEPGFPSDVLYSTRGNSVERSLTFIDTNTGNPLYTTVVKVVSVNVENITERDNVEINIIQPDTFTASVTYWSGWNDRYNYVPTGESDKTSNVLIATDNETCPLNQNFFNLEQDIKDYDIKIYNVSIDVVPTTYDGKVTVFDNSLRTIGDVYNTNINATHRVVNNYNEITEFIKDYYASSN